MELHIAGPALCGDTSFVRDVTAGLWHTNLGGGAVVSAHSSVDDTSCLYIHIKYNSTLFCSINASVGEHYRMGPSCYSEAC